MDKAELGVVVATGLRLRRGRRSSMQGRTFSSGALTEAGFEVGFEVGFGVGLRVD